MLYRFSIISKSVKTCHREVGVLNFRKALNRQEEPTRIEPKMAYDGDDGNGLRFPWCWW